LSQILPSGPLDGALGLGGAAKSSISLRENPAAFQGKPRWLVTFPPGILPAPKGEDFSLYICAYWPKAAAVTDGFAFEP
jgi:hypothetical protein